jgi:hypothetical protein
MLRPRCVGRRKPCCSKNSENCSALCAPYSSPPKREHTPNSHPDQCCIARFWPCLTSWSMILSTVAAIVAPRRLNLHQALNLNQPQSRRKWSSQRPHPLRPHCLPRKWHRRRRHDRESATPVHPDRNWGRHYPLPNTSKPLHGARGLPVVAQTALQIRRPRQHRRHRLGSGTHPWSSGVIALHITLHHHHSAERNPRALCGSRLCTSRLQYRHLR